MLLHTRQFLVLFIAVLILLTGHGLQLTLVPLRAEALGWDVTAIGTTGTFYFVGFLLGCVLIPRFVGAVGHVRVFSATTTICGTALILILTSDSVAVWSSLRLLTGFGISGSYIIIESWLNEQTSNEQRGRVLATYTVIVLGGMSLGQLLINLGDALSIVTLVVGSALLSCAIIPLSLIRVREPAIPQQVQFGFRTVYRASPAAVGTAFSIGMVTGAFYTLTPVASARFGFEASQTAFVMMALVLGGAAFQLPAGRLSDKFDRRKVMLGALAAGAAVISVSLPFDLGFSALLVLIFVLGGIGSAIYPICLAHANDRHPGHFLQVGTVILLVNSMGAATGPLLGSLSMAGFGATGFFVFALIGMLITLLWLIYCVAQRSAPADTTTEFVVVAKSSPELMVLDPRVDEEATEEAASSPGHPEQMTEHEKTR